MPHSYRSVIVLVNDEVTIIIILSHVAHCFSSYIMMSSASIAIIREMVILTWDVGRVSVEEEWMLGGVENFFSDFACLSG